MARHSSADNALVLGISLQILERSGFLGEFRERGIYFALLYGVGIAGPFDVFMNLDSGGINGDVGQFGIDPPARVVIANSFALFLHGGVGMAAKNTVDFAEAGMEERSGSDFRRHTQPARVHAIDQASDGFAFQIEALQLQIKDGAEIAEANTVDPEAVELVAVDGEMLFAIELPGVLLINVNANEVGHDVGEPLVMIAFDPDDFNFSLGIGELADEAEKFPVFFGEPAEIKVGKDVAQKDEAAEAGLFEEAGSFARVAALRPQMDVGEDQRIVDGRIHCYRNTQLVLRNDEIPVNVGLISNFGG
jgi:hypothetical protein